MRYLILFLLLIPVVSATSVIDISTGREITHASITITAGNVTSDYVIQLGDPLVLPTFTTAAQVVVHENFSANITHAAIIPANTNTTSLLVYPAGVVRLTVKDQRDNLIAGASVNISCPRIAAVGMTNAAGDFVAIMPAEDCIITVIDRNDVTTKRTLIGQGINDETVVIERGIIRRVSYTPIIILLIVIAIAIIVYAFHARKKRFVAVNVKRALTPKEQLIVDALMARGGKASLAELRANVKIPRTSLLRTLEGLEHRGVLLKTSSGTKVIVELTK